MPYNFDAIINRRHSNSYKWDSSPADKNSNIIPLWVADMDFKTAPAIIDALTKRVEHGIFGYVHVPDEYYDSVINWFSRRHGFNFQASWMIYTLGVVPALSAVIKALTQPGDGVLVQTPVYNCFFSSIRNNGCKIVSSPLIYQDRTYHIDFVDLEQKAADPSVKVMLLCNPHNPAGRVWTKEELIKIGDICRKHNVTVVADEIHCELVFDDHKYIPFASISQEHLLNSVTCISASKAFNIAGLQIANIIVQDDAIRQKINKAININEVCDVNPFGIEATMAAYNQSEDWLLELLQYIKANYDHMCEFFNTKLPQIPVTKLEGTYLAWTDCRCFKISSDDLEVKLRDQTGLWLNSGTMYGDEGEGFMRWNLACPRAVLDDALNRFHSFAQENL